LTSFFISQFEILCITFLKTPNKLIKNCPKNKYHKVGDWKYNTKRKQKINPHTALMDKRILILVLLLGLVLGKTLESRPFKSHKRDG